MARITDTTKIERLKVSTMKLVAENGYGGASAARIAKEAKVAVGYFYMHYKGKYELVNSLLSDFYQEVAAKLNELISEGSSFNSLIDNLISYYLEIASNEPVKIKFFHAISNDNRFTIDPSIKNSIYQLILRIMEIGNMEGSLDKNITDDDLYVYLVINSIQHINLHFKRSNTHIFSALEKQHLLYLTHKILK